MAVITFEGGPTPRLLDDATLDRMAVNTGTPGHLELIEVVPRKRVIFLAREDGPVALWSQPVRNSKYIVGASWRPDCSAAFVIDRRTGDQVAIFRKTCTPAEFADQVNLLGRFYNWAFLVPEFAANGFCDALLPGYPSDLIFNRYRVSVALGIGADGPSGFEMTEVSRVQLVQALQAALTGIGASIVIRSSITIEECRGFALQPRGKPGFAGGSGAACVWAAALAAYGLQSMPREHQSGVKHLKGFEPLGKRR